MCRPAHSLAGRPGYILLLLFLSLCGCVSPAPRLQPGNIGIIAGKDTDGLNDEMARGKVLSEAARLTVDHGYRYFLILPAADLPAARTNMAAVPIRAGRSVRFQILHRTPPLRTPGVWDAYRLLAQKSQSH